MTLEEMEETTEAISASTGWPWADRSTTQNPVFDFELQDESWAYNFAYECMTEYNAGVTIKRVQRGFVVTLSYHLT